MSGRREPPARVRSVPPDGRPAAPPPIEPGAVLLHIGPPKTGSTGIQNSLHAQREELARHGVRYAGADYRPKAASWAVLGIGPAVGQRRPRMDDWNALVDEVTAHTDVRVCVSSEDFARASPEAAARVVHDLGTDRVHLVHVVRRLDRLLPSLWQERVKARLTRPFEDWLEAVLQEEESTHFEWRNFWRPHEVDGILERWGAVVPRERITLVCSDDRDRALIPAAFEGLLGLPDGMLRAIEPRLSNRSLTGNEAELLRRINQVAAAEKWTAQEYLTICQLGVVAGFRKSPPAPDDQPIPPLPDWARKRVAEISRRQVAAIRSAGVRVVGDPDTLLIDDSTEAPEVAEQVTTMSIDTAVTAVLGAVAGGRRLTRAAGRDARKQARRASGKKAAATKGAGPAGRRPAHQLSSSELLRIVAGRARRRLRRG